MDPVAVLVLGTSVLFIGFTLLALLGRAHRSRLVASWVAMIGFAFFASFCFWKRMELQRTAVPVYYNLPTSVGSHRLMLFKPGLSPGYRIRIVRRSDRTFDQELKEKLFSCGWRITKCEQLALSMYTFDEGDVLEFDSEYPDLVLRYEATPGTASLLETAAIEVTCPTGFHKPMGQWLATLNSRTAFFLGALVLAGLGASVQRRKLRAQAAASKPQPPTS